MSGIMPAGDDRISESASLCARGLDGLGNGFLKSFHDRERDFLRLGKALDGFNSRALAVSREAAELTELTSGEAVVQAMARLSSLLERMGTVCGATSTGSEITGLDVIASVGSKLSENMRDFARLVKHLTMLGIATRIESARLGNQGLGFSTLADDVEKLAGKIVVSSEKILKRSQDLISQCREAGKNITEMDEARTSCSSSVLDKLQAELRALEGLTATSRQNAAEVSSLAEKTVANVSEAVHSMQFHDIIRQQLEHVAETTDEARTMAVEGPLTEGGHNAQTWEELAGWMESVLVLQRSQLGNAQSRFAEAMHTLESSLREIAGSVESMASRAGSLASQEVGQGSALGQIESEVRHVAQSLRDYSALERRMAKVMGEVGDSINDMSASVSEIEEVGAEIELIALNASVKAAHTGEEGKALGVLASAIQKLSVDARAQTNTIMELLGSVDSASLALAGMDTIGEENMVVEEVVADLDSEVANLKELEEQAVGSAKRVRDLAMDLSREIGETVDSLEFQHGLLEAMTVAEVKLQKLIEALQKVLPAGMGMSQSPKLREMLDRYTMDAERLVHENVLGITSESVGQEDEGEFGGNVELF